MNTTINLPQAPQGKRKRLESNLTHVNGFPNLNRVPEVFHDFLLFIRKSNARITISYKSENNKEIFIITYPGNFNIEGMLLLEKLIANTKNPAYNIVNQYRLVRFSQLLNGLPTIIELKKRSVNNKA